jgi:DNA-3-methyladenine glycosylase
MHWLLNFVTEEEGFPGAVLVRAIQPEEGLDLIAERRMGQPRRSWTDGPAKICQALSIDGKSNGLDICHPDAGLFVEMGLEFSPDKIFTGPRIGLNGVPEPWQSIPWRFVVHYQDL